MLDIEQTKAQIRRLSTIHPSLASARTFEAFVDTIQRDTRLSDIDVAHAVDELMAATDDVRIIPGRVIDYGMRHRAGRLAVHRATHDDDRRPSVVPCFDKCSRCKGDMVILVVERKRYCGACNRVGMHELDPLTVDAEVRLFTESRALRMQEAA